MYGKLKDGVLELAPRSVIIGDKRVWNPKPEQLKALGYKSVKHTEQPQDAPEGQEYVFRWGERGENIVQEWHLVDKEPPRSTLEERVTALEQVATK